jgi:S-adenosylmethionine hydrolase
MTSPLIAILTDFGTSDPFVGIMKGVIAQIAPGVPTIDLTHEIPPGDIRRAAVELWRSTPYFPNGTVFLCVVDPGVGTARRSVIVTGNLMQDRTEKAYTFVGPDNGTFTFLEHTLPAWELKSPSFALQGASSTFHGRDVYAPAAAYAALGHAGAEFGPPVKELVRLPLPRLKTSANGQLQGEILHADHFGNLKEASCISGPGSTVPRRLRCSRSFFPALRPASTCQEI